MKENMAVLHSGDPSGGSLAFLHLHRPSPSCPRPRPPRHHAQPSATLPRLPASPFRASSPDLGADGAWGLSPRLQFPSAASSGLQLHAKSPSRPAAAAASLAFARSGTPPRAPPSLASVFNRWWLPRITPARKCSQIPRLLLPLPHQSGRK
ncbi:hypothetical protein ABZP36_011490 [Zizania latifolia]